MKSFGLSHRAVDSLEAIAVYSRDRFGQKRGLAYVDALLDRCRSLAIGQLQGRPCRSQFGEDMRDDLRSVRSGSHFVIYVDTPSGVTIIDFIHQSADIGGRLGGPEE